AAYPAHRTPRTSSARAECLPYAGAGGEPLAPGLIGLDLKMDLTYNPERLPDEVLALCIDPPKGKGLRWLRVEEPPVLVPDTCSSSGCRLSRVTGAPGPGPHRGPDLRLGSVVIGH